MTPQPVDFLLLHAQPLLSCAGPAPRRGSGQSNTTPIDDGAIAAFEGRIVRVGPTGEVLASVAPTDSAVVLDLRRGASVVPGFVDAHTHAVFAGDRRGETRRRLAGETYAQIAASGGGIVSTVAATRQATPESLAGATRTRLDAMLACGTTTCEIKSGYGLTVDAELRLLRAVRAAADGHPVSVVSTFLGAHEVPLEFRADRDRYVDLVVEDMIPAVADERLAEWCDVFCEEGVFTPAESLRILTAGANAGLKSRIHADELASSGGARVAAAVGARSADHLIFVSADDMQRLAAANVTATLLPIAAFYLKIGRYAPARELIAAGVPVALATDLNPGGGLSPSLPFAMTLACFAMGMTFEEALVASTLNAAWSLDRAESVGSLEPGKIADIVVVDGDPVNLLGVGARAIRAVIKHGRVVSGNVAGITAAEGHESHR